MCLGNQHLCALVYLCPSFQLVNHLTNFHETRCQHYALEEAQTP